MSDEECRSPEYVPKWADPAQRCDYLRPYAGLCGDFARLGGTRCPQHEGKPQRDPGRTCEAEGCGRVPIRDKPFCPRHDPEIKAARQRKKEEQERRLKRIAEAREASVRAFHKAVKDLCKGGLLPQGFDLLVAEGYLKTPELLTLFLVPLAAVLKQRGPECTAKKRRS